MRAQNKVAVSPTIWYTTIEGSAIAMGEAEQPVWVKKWAQQIEALGLTSIALLIIEVARPFGFLGSQALFIAQPLLASIADSTAIEQATALLDSPELLNQLRVCLEGGEPE